MPNNKNLQAANYVLSKVNQTAEMALVLGSGLGNFVEQLDRKTRIPFADIPGFPLSTVAGHSGELIHGFIGNIPLWVNSGRVHFYEGYNLGQVVFPIDVLAALGARAIILTNAAGSIRKEYAPGELMLIERVLNLTGRAVDGDPQIARQMITPDRLEHILGLARNHNLSLKQGTYAGLNGPSYETPAEIRFLRLKHADAVGMSTVHEALQARQLGLDVIAISCLTNYAAGILDQPLNHEEVMETGRRVQADFARLLTLIIRDYPSPKTAS